MLTSNSYALLIGINDDTTHDALAGRPKGASDLPGAFKDARAFYRECRDLGIPSENIFILTSPRLSPSDLEGDGSGPNVITGEATRAEILDKVAWLAARLGATSQVTELLTDSGHRPGSTSAQPDAADGARQLDPGSRGYTLYQMSANSTVFASILVAHTTQTIGGVTYTAGTEYWSMNATGPGTSDVTMTTSGSLDWPGGASIPNFPVANALPTFTMPSSITWASTGTNPSGVHIKTSTGLKEGIKFNLSYNGMTQVWSGDVTFYQTVATGGSATPYALTSGGTLTYNSGPVSPLSNTSWYKVTLNP